MAEETDYKRLWRNSQSENKTLANLLFEANNRLNALIDVLNKLKSGELKLEEIDKARADVVMANLGTTIKTEEVKE
jgi:(p)ppGpp synthase/HD superfamily hydrolase